MNNQMGKGRALYSVRWYRLTDDARYNLLDDAVCVKSGSVDFFITLCPTEHDVFRLNILQFLSDWNRPG